MQREEFLDHVQNRAQLNTRDDADIATRATLVTLAERLAGDEPHDAASQLPGGIKEYLEHEFAGAGERFSLDEFFSRISEREGVSLQDAMRHARAVLQVLRDAISEGEVNDIKSQLPSDFEVLFA